MCLKEIYLGNIFLPISIQLLSPILWRWKTVLDRCNLPAVYENPPELQHIGVNICNLLMNILKCFLKSACCHPLELVLKFSVIVDFCKFKI